MIEFYLHGYQLTSNIRPMTCVETLWIVFASRKQSEKPLSLARSFRMCLFVPRGEGGMLGPAEITLHQEPQELEPPGDPRQSEPRRRRRLGG